jgi:hypothetical protein
VPITFTHNDIHRRNIIVSQDRAQILAIVDWHQSGWLPSSWEYCKARWTTATQDEWEVVYLPQILEPFDGYKFWDYFVSSLGM